MDNDDEIERKMVSQITNELLLTKRCCENFQKIFTRFSNELQSTINSASTISPLTQIQTRLRRQRGLKTTRKSEVKAKKKSIFGKIYQVQSIQEGERIIGYRVHTKYMDVNHCIGPYASLEEATNIKQLIQSKLKEFNSNDPDVESKVAKRLIELKVEYDAKYPPLKMVRSVHNK